MRPEYKRIGILAIHIIKFDSAGRGPNKTLKAKANQTTKIPMMQHLLKMYDHDLFETQLIHAGIIKKNVKKTICAIFSTKTHPFDLILYTI
jgi:hypothetical protein